MFKKIKDKTGITTMLFVVIGIILFAITVGSVTKWFFTVNSNIDAIDERLYAMSLASSEWYRINTMSTEDIETQKNKLANYKVGDYDVQLSLGSKGKMVDTNCVIGSSDNTKATCYKDTRITIRKNNKTLYSSKFRPLTSQPSFYNKDEFNDKLNYYIKNESYEEENKKNKVSVKYEKNILSGDYLLNDYIDEQLIENSSNVAIIYPRGSKTSPGILYASEWVELSNPFPDYYVHVEVQIYVAGRWTQTGFARMSTYDREGTVTLQKDAHTIVVWSKEDVACTCGGYIPNSYTNLKSAPFRVIVTKLGKYEL